jgi:hypothetical protein
LKSTSFFIKEWGKEASQRDLPESRQASRDKAKVLRCQGGEWWRAGQAPEVRGSHVALHSQEQFLPQNLGLHVESGDRF